MPVEPFTRPSSRVASGSRPRLVHVTTAPVALLFLTGQLRYMRERGFDVLAVSSPCEALDAFGEIENVTVHAVQMPRRITPWRDLVAIAGLYRYLRRVRPHIVHTHTPKGGLLGTIAAALARVPVRIYHVHGLPCMTATGLRRVLLRLSEIVACTLAHRVLCVSHSVRAVAIDERLCRYDKIAVRGPGSINGVDAAGQFDPDRWKTARADIRREHGIPAEAVVVGFAGRIVRDKGIGELMRAWARLSSEFAELHLLVVGPFEPQDALPPEVEAELRSDPRVHLAGDQVEMAPFYAAMDIVVLPSYREGFPVVPLEAAAMRLPVVATRIPGCVEAVRDGVTGALVPPHDSDALADALGAYVRDAALRRSHGGAGRSRVLKEFRPETIWDALHDEYVRLLRGAGAEPVLVSRSIAIANLK